MPFEVSLIGLGKLGLPVAVAIAEQGHTVYGFDIDAEKRTAYELGDPTPSGADEPYLADRLSSAIEAEQLRITDRAMTDVDIVFIAVPTPEAADGGFDLEYLEAALAAVGGRLAGQDRTTAVSVISTVLPGTMAKLAPVLEAQLKTPLGERVGLAHTPSFTAMSSTIEDYHNPEFALIGAETPWVRERLHEFYIQTTANDCPIRHLSWASTAMAKMTYNTAIGLKIAFANAVMELCHYTPGADADAVASTLQQATDRVASGKYLRGGMGDGGGCHPKDGRALAMLADQHDLSANPFEFAIEARRTQTAWLAGEAAWKADETGTPITVIGARYKAETTLTLESPSLLLADYLEEWGFDPTVYDPPAGYDTDPPAEAHTFIVTTEAAFARNYDYPPGSTVIDIWRCLDLPESIDHVPIGAAD